MEIDFDDPKWRLKARATALFQRHGSNLACKDFVAKKIVWRALDAYLKLEGQ